MIELFRYIEQSFVSATQDDTSINVENDSDFQNGLRSARNQTTATERMREEAEAYVNANFSDSSQRTVQLGNQLREFHHDIQHLESTNAEDVHQLIERIFDQTSQDLVDSNSFREDKNFLDDSLVAVKLVTAFDRVDSSALVAMRQAIAFIEDVAQEQLTETDPEKIKSRLLRSIRVPKSLLPPQATATTPPPNDDGQNQERERIEALQREANVLKTTYQTLMSVYPDDLEIVPIRGETPLASTELASTASVERISAQQNDQEELTSASGRSVLALSQPLLRRVPDDVRNTLDSLGVNVATTALPNLVSRIKDRWIAVTQELQPHIAPVPATVYQLGIHTFAIQPLTKITAQPLPMPDFSHAVTRPVGIGNLQVVRQELIGYEAGEISHIENVLEGELFRRSTTRTESTDITVTRETETIQTDERDVQSTDRNELASETQKEASKQTVATQGQSTTTDYGKVVENSKTNYARSVTDKAVNSLTQKVKEQRITREQRSFTEKIVHEFDNRTGTSKVRGIYQWVDKKFKTRIMNYGRRLLYDVVIPEPAAFLIDSLKNAQQPEAFKLTKPTAPWFNPQDLNSSNYMYWAKYYGITGAVEPPPDEFIETIATADSLNENVSKLFTGPGGKITDTGGGITFPEVKFWGLYYHHFIIKTPPGYKAVGGYVQRQIPFWNGINGAPPVHLILYIGEDILLQFGGSTANLLNQSFKMYREVTGDIPVTLVSGAGVLQFNYAVGINCKLTDKANERWQLKTFAAITEGYRRQLAEYEDKLAQRQATVRTQMTLLQNYAHNPAIEQTELKKAFIHLLMSEHFTNVNYPTPDPNQFPTDPTYVKKWGAVVAFFERAFEWDNIIYNYYPYFWGQKSRWGELILIQDLDVQFEEFLKAGAARVVIPVRPGFEGAMAHYHETGDVWMGEEIPDMFSDLYVSIIDEIKARNYAPGEEVCVAEWDVKLPTTLVMLKEDATLPEWTSKVICNPPDA